MKQSFILRLRNAWDDLILLSSLFSFLCVLEKNPHTDSHKGKSLETTTENHTAVISLAKFITQLSSPEIYKGMQIINNMTRGLAKTFQRKIILTKQFYCPSSLSQDIE